MSTVQKTQGKAKPATKPATTTKPATKPATTTATPWTVVAYIVAYINAALATKGETYYHSAMAYHKATTFPRERNNATRAELMLAKEGDKMHDRVKAVFKAHATNVLASGNKDGQAVFDIYRIATK